MSVLTDFTAGDYIYNCSACGRAVVGLAGVQRLCDKCYCKGDPMNTDKPQFKKNRRPSISVTDLVAQIAGQVADEKISDLNDAMLACKRRDAALRDDFNTHIAHHVQTGYSANPDLPGAIKTELLGKMLLIDQESTSRFKYLESEIKKLKQQHAAPVFSDPCADVAKREAEAVYAAIQRDIRRLKSDLDDLSAGTLTRHAASKAQLGKYLADLREFKRDLDNLSASAVSAQITLKDQRVMINELKAELRQHRINHAQEADARRIENSLQRVGFPWPAEEDAQLKKEVLTALETIAANHGRTAHSIRCRIQDKKVLVELSC